MELFEVVEGAEVAEGHKRRKRCITLSFRTAATC